MKVEEEMSVGQKVFVELNDGQTVTGRIYNIDEAYWGRKRKPEKTISLNINQNQTAHFPFAAIKTWEKQP